METPEVFHSEQNHLDIVYQQPMIQGPFLFIPGTEIFPISKRQLCWNNSSSGFQMLDEQSKIFIKQKSEISETMFDCEPQKKFNVCALGQNESKKGQKLFKCTEKSNYCSRNFLSTSCQPFQMTISIVQKGTEEKQSSPFLVLERPFQSTFLGFNRPYVTVTLIEDGKNEYLGKITEPYSWCEMELRVYDKDGNPKYLIQENNCQCGVFSQCPFESCSTANFDIKTASGNEIVSNLQKKTGGCKTGFDDMYSFLLNFPLNSLASDKALLMSAVLFLDYQYFTTKP